MAHPLILAYGGRELPFEMNKVDRTILAPGGSANALRRRRSTAKGSALPPCLRPLPRPFRS